VTPESGEIPLSGISGPVKAVHEVDAPGFGWPGSFMTTAVRGVAAPSKAQRPGADRVRTGHRSTGR
jgi:hypothetical protein